MPTVWDQGVGGTPAAQVIRDNLRWSVLWTVRTAPDDGDYPETVRQVEEAFRWWATFGGLGARTRRGLGAFAVTDVAGAEFSYVSADEVAQAGLRLVLGKPQPNANTAWQDAIEALREYRQGVGVGRHPPSRGHRSPAGRSCWPEADALRRLGPACGRSSADASGGQYLSTCRFRFADHFPFQPRFLS